MGRVRRTGTSCCGMVQGEIYEAKIKGRYIACLVHDEWTTDHFAGEFEKGDTTWFEKLPTPPKSER